LSTGLNSTTLASQGAQFAGDSAGIGAAQFNGLTADFIDAHFGRCLLRQAQFTGIANFRWGQFSGYASFSHAEFSGAAVFTDVACQQEH
jgi:uncharacterized protein YjbI with pentapeptide repeats